MSSAVSFLSSDTRFKAKCFYLQALSSGGASAVGDMLRYISFLEPKFNNDKNEWISLEVQKLVYVSKTLKYPIVVDIVCS